MNEKKLKILLVDDHPIVREGFAKLLSEQPSYEVVSQVGSGQLAIDFIRYHPVDVAVIDINMPGIDGLRTTQRLTTISPELKVVILSVNEMEPFISKSFEAGARGFLSKRCAPEELIDAIKVVCKGEQYLSACVYKQMALDKLNKKEDVLKTLTQREFEVFQCLARGDTMNDIAEKLHISPKTGYVFRGKIMKKLNVMKLTDLIHIANRYQILEQ